MKTNTNTVYEMQTGTVVRNNTECGVFNQVKRCERNGRVEWLAIVSLVDGVPFGSKVCRTLKAALHSVGA